MKQTGHHKDEGYDQVLVQDENVKNLRTPPKATGARTVVVRRRRANGSPILPLNLDLPVKNVYMIRHGQSLGQVAHLHGLNRRTDARLRDCDLTGKGRDQARAIPSSLLCSTTGEQLLQPTQKQ